jgi:NAD(P)-dependent dehydrogenase (short-subunit alcohol dehydrogenase family)
MTQQRPRALVTGSRTGLGRSLALALYAAGWEVHGVSRRIDPSLPIAQTALDLADAAAVDHWLATATPLLDSVDLLVCNAGSGIAGEWEDWTRDSIRESLRLMLESPLLVMAAVHRSMRARGGGTIVAVTSLAAVLPIPLMPGYNAAKAGLAQAMRTLRMVDDAAHGVCWIDFQAGDFRTGFNDQLRLVGPHGGRAAALKDVWQTQMAVAPACESVSRTLLAAVARRRSGVVRAGSLFQRWIAPLGMRLLPDRWMLALIRAYYRLPLRRPPP